MTAATIAAFRDLDQPPRPAPGWRVLTLAECATIKPAPYLVKGLIRPGDVVILFGAPGAGKSVLAPYLAHAVATGRTIFGRRVRRAPVLYAAPEDGEGMILRGAALRRVYGEAPGLLLIPEPLDLATLSTPANVLSPEPHDPTPEDARRLRDLAEHYRAGLVVLDTLAAAFPGLAENEAAAMDHVVRIARYVAATGAAVMLIHHAPKNAGDKPRPRGHGRLEGDADTTLHVEAADGGTLRSVSIGKNRAGSALATLAFTIRSEELGTDPDGDPITAPVAEEAEGEASKPAKARRDLNDKQRGWLRDLADMLASAEAVSRAPVEGMKQTLTLTRDQVREGLRVRGRFEAEPHAPLTPKDRRALSDTLNALRDKGKIGMTDSFVWLT